MKKLSTAQMNLLEQIAKKGESGMYVVSHFPPLKKLLEAGLIQATKIKGGLGTTSDHYVVTPLGVVALGGTVGLKEPVKAKPVQVPADEITAAFLDVLDGNVSSDAISDFTGLPRERCVEISKLAIRLFDEYDTVGGKWVRM